jgi:Coenzyme PQQ synthesis protein D (PqqD)
MAPISMGSRVSAVPDQVSGNLGEEAVILHVTKGVYYGLNEVGATVWNLIQQRPRSVREVCDAVAEEFAVDPDRCEQDVTTLLEKLLDEGLIEVANGSSPS